MGFEAECTVRVGRRTSTGTARLEGETLLFRGDFRLDIPFERVREASVDGDTLVVVSEDEARFELGAAIAARWLRLIRQPKGLFEKLEIDSQSRVAIVDLASGVFTAALRELAGNVTEGRVPEGAPVVFFGAETRDALRKVALLRTRMVDAGVLWIIRPKASRTISEADLRDAVRDAGLVETKVVAFSKTHTAHKCVIPVELRGQARRRPPVVTIPPAAPGALAPVPSLAAGSGARSRDESAGPRASSRPAAAKRSAIVPKKRH
jgi:hypothetical protein